MFRHDVSKKNTLYMIRPTQPKSADMMVMRPSSNAEKSKPRTRKLYQAALGIYKT